MNEYAFIKWEASLDFSKLPLEHANFKKISEKINIKEQNPMFKIKAALLSDNCL